MSMVDDNERRKIAQSLRDSWKQTWHGEKMMHRLRIALGIGHEVSAYGKFRYYRAVAERLADLIEPEPERTCRMEYDTVHGDFVCSECGAWVRTDAARTLCGSSLKYCPNCGAKVVDSGA